MKLFFCDFWQHFDREGFIFTRALREHHKVEIVDDPAQADIVVFSIFGQSHLYVPDRCVKVFYTGENICPDFNMADYAIGFEYLDYGDRYIRLPNYYCTPFGVNATLRMEHRPQLSAEEALQRRFCAMVISAEPVGRETERQRIYRALCQYKTVDSGGRWNNNVGGPVPDKIQFQSGYKFALAAENSVHPGYTTEKLVEAFASGCVPIYWGDPEVTRVFNPDAFFRAADFASYAQLADEVRRLDTDSDAYLAMLSASPLVCPERDSYEVVYAKAVAWADHIADQPLPDAIRRSQFSFSRIALRRQFYESWLASVSPSAFDRLRIRLGRLKDQIRKHL